VLIVFLTEQKVRPLKSHNNFTGYHRGLTPIQAKARDDVMIKIRTSSVPTDQPGARDSNRPVPATRPRTIVTGAVFHT